MLALTLFISLYSVNVSAADNEVTIIIGLTGGTKFTVDGEITWLEYINNNKPYKLTYSEIGIYYDGYRIHKYGTNDYVSPYDVIVPDVYAGTSACNLIHSYNSEMLGGLPTNCYPITYRHTCTICGYMYFEQVPSAIPHTIALDSTTYVRPTCTSTGYEAYACTVCGYVQSSNILPKIEHDFIIESLSGTVYPCVEQINKYSCKNCDYSYTETIQPTKSHSFGVNLNTYVRPTCTSTGYESIECTICGLVQSQNVLPMKEHNIEKTLTSGLPVPCTQQVYRYSCADCDYSYTETIEPSANHNFGVDVNSYVVPTCTTTGYQRIVCLSCGLFNSDEILGENPQGHIPEGATCVIPGICKNCGVTCDIDKYSHNMSAATCTEPQVCKDCGKEGKSALDHKLNVWGKCEREGCDYNAVATGFEDLKDKAGESKLDIEEWFKNIYNDTKTTGEMIIDTIMSVVALVIILVVIYFVSKIVVNFLKAKKIIKSNKKRGK